MVKSYLSIDLLPALEALKRFLVSSSISNSVNILLKLLGNCCLDSSIMLLFSKLNYLMQTDGDQIILIGIIYIYNERFE